MLTHPWGAALDAAEWQAWLESTDRFGVLALNNQLADFQPEGRHADVAVGAAPYGRMLPGIRGVRLAGLRVEAKFNYDDHNPVEHRERVIGNLERRGRGIDAGAATQRRRRLAAIGDWQPHQDQP